MATKWDIDKLIEFYNLNGCKLLSVKYKNEDSILDYICECGNEDSKKFSAFKRSPHCRDCYKNSMSQKMSFSFKKIKKEFESQGCILLSNEYVNAWQHLKYICICGNESVIQYANFRKGVRCKGCNNKRKYNEENMKKIMEESNCKYISQNGTDSNTSYVKFICHCGRISEKGIRYFIKNKRCNDCSHESFVEKVSGENSVNWNKDITKEEREELRDFPEYEKWRIDVFKRDNYTCKCCGIKGHKINAHHKDGYHWNKERRLDLSNGVTLCEECHKDFHKQCGIRNNTEEQFEEWINVKNNDLNEVI
jgi:hypothetical protein